MQFATQLCNWFFHANPIIYIAIAAVLIFAANTTGSLLKEINDIKKGRWDNRDQATIILKPDSKIKTATLVIIDSNSNYLFAIDKNTRVAAVISKDQIAEIEVKQK